MAKELVTEGGREEAEKGKPEMHLPNASKQTKTMQYDSGKGRSSWN